MGNSNETRVILGSLRYKSAPDTTIMLNVPFIQTTKENVQFERNINIDLEQVFFDERQGSDNFRPSAKFNLLFYNAYSGTSNYVPFENNMYYVNELEASISQCDTSAQQVSWSGLPQYNEFDFIRTDYNLIGYTQPPNNHINFIPKSASSYNWNFFVSYAFENDYNKPLSAVEGKTGVAINWTSGDGIPFVIVPTTYKGQDVIMFRCPVKHGLTKGEYVKLNFSYNNTDMFEVYTLGDGADGSQEYIFSIDNIGYTGSPITQFGTTGTFKRVINPTNPNETTSEYYARKNKILTNSQDAVMVNAGFDQNIFGNRKKFQSSGLTPNQISRIATKEGSQSYTLSFNDDVTISNLIDNQKRPLTELFITTMWKGYFGVTLGTLKNNGQGYNGLRQGYEFNLPLVGGNVNSWWSVLNSNSETPFPIDVYNTAMGATGGPSNSPIPFTYVRSLNKGDVLDGDLCEWNDMAQEERVISNLFHKFTMNPFVFNISNPPQSPSNRYGYYYQPHSPMTIRVFSDYIETGDKQQVEGIPNYSYYSENQGVFLWRDLYPYGFIDTSGLGVNYPFLNGKHYPYTDIIFRIIPEGTNYIEQVLVTDPLIDDCE
jgi:hypothetical protein